MEMSQQRRVLLPTPPLRPVTYHSWPMQRRSFGYQGGFSDTPPLRRQGTEHRVSSIVPGGFRGVPRKVLSRGLEKATLLPTGQQCNTERVAPAQTSTQRSETSQGPTQRSQAPRSSQPSTSATGSIPPPYFEVTRAQFMIIKCSHHLTNLSRGTPASLRKTADTLGKQLRPAFCDDAFRATAKALATSWLSGSVNALREHYESTLKAAETHVQMTPMSEESFETSLRLAVKWSKTQLRSKLRDTTLDGAITRIKELQALTIAPSSLPASMTNSSNAPTLATTTSVNSQNPDQPSPMDSAPEPPPSTSAPSVPQLPSDVLAESIIVSSTKQRPPQAAPPTLAASRVADRHPAPASSQLDLFGSPVESLRGTPCQNQPLELDWKSNVVLGDANLAGLQHSDTTVLARTKGKLSHFQHLFRVVTQTFINVTAIVLCLTTLDRHNALTSKISALKSLLGALHRVFPKAKIYVLACGIDERFSDVEKRSCSDLNSFVGAKTPSSSFYVPATEPFVCHNDVWDDSTKQKTYAIIKNYLN